MTKSSFKKSVRHYVIAIEKRHQNNVTFFSSLPPSQSKFLATPVLRW